jgi:hypothetical protein
MTYEDKTAIVWLVFGRDKVVSTRDVTGRAKSRSLASLLFAELRPSWMTIGCVV